MISASGKGYLDWMKRVLWILCFVTSTLHAQYFNNNAFQFQLGWMGFDTTAQFLNPSPNPWPTTDQIQLGLGYQYDLWDYKLWWVTQTAASFGYARNYGLLDTQILIGLNSLTGLRYNFTTDAWRPFVLGGVGLFVLFQNPNQAANNLLPTPVTSSQAWMTFQVGPGIEWFFADEMSFQLDVGGLVFLDFQREARFSYLGRFSYLFYF